MKGTPTQLSVGVPFMGTLDFRSNINLINRILAIDFHF